MYTADTKSRNVKWTIGWGYTSRCDLNCAFCYSRRVRRGNATLEIHFDDARSFVIHNQYHVGAFNFGTGECFLAPMFTDLLKICADTIPGVDLAVTTNGAFFDAANTTEKVELYRNCISELDVSIDFAKSEDHDSWRGKPGCWARAINAVKLAFDMGIATSIVMVGTKQTLQEQNVAAMLELAESHGVALRINLFMPTAGDFSFSPSTATVWSLLEQLQEHESIMRSSDPLIGPRTDTYQPGLHLAAHRSCRVLPDGRVTPSTYLLDAPWTLDGSLITLDLGQIVETEPFRKFSSAPVPNECRNCAYSEVCRGGSVERRWLWFQRLDRRDPYCPGPSFQFTKRSFPFGGAFETRWNGPTVHLDYLPTIIVCPPSKRSTVTD